MFIWRNSNSQQTPHVSPYFPHIFKWLMLTFHWWDPGSSHVPRATSSCVCGSSVSMLLVLTVVSAAAEVTESWWWCSDSSWGGFLLFCFSAANIPYPWRAESKEGYSSPAGQHWSQSVWGQTFGLNHYYSVL